MDNTVMFITDRLQKLLSVLNQLEDEEAVYGVVVVEDDEDEEDEVPSNSFSISASSSAVGSGG